MYIHIYIYIYTQYHTPTTPPGGRGTVLWLAAPWPWRGGGGLELLPDGMPETSRNYVRIIARVRIT